MKLEGKSAIVTGAAQGIGRAIVLTLARDGADVVLADIDVDLAGKVVDEIKDLGRKAIAMKVDVTKSADTRLMAEKTLDEFGKIDILVNNAGQGARERASLFADSTEDIWDFVITLNFKGVLNCCRAVIEHMMQWQSGKIVSVASRLGVIGAPGLADYSAAKAATIGFSRALAKEAASYGINVNCVSPGPIDTRDMDSKPPEVVEMMKKNSGLGRLGKPEEVAHMVAFLVSDEANFITGQNFIVSGPPS